MAASTNDETVDLPVTMYRYEELNAGDDRGWNEAQSHEESTVFQTHAWISFVARTQRGTPVLAALKDGDRTVGYFAGLIVKKFCVRILGSPCPGWSTDYMGFSLVPGACRKSALRGLFDFAFQQLGCAHVEVMDRHLTQEDLVGSEVQYRLYQGFAVDLRQDEARLFGNLSSACRRCIRKADKDGVVIEVAQAAGFAEDYFAQLKDVFAKQALVPTYSLDRVTQLIAHLHPVGQVLLLRARDRAGRSIATGIFPFLNGVMYFWGGASWREFQIQRPNQALHWFAMRYAKAHGVHTYDMGGAGEYKRQYGGGEICVPWIRKSKYAWVETARNLARGAYTLRQRVLGQMRRISVVAQGVFQSPSIVSLRDSHSATSLKKTGDRKMRLLSAALSIAAMCISSCGDDSLRTLSPVDWNVMENKPSVAQPLGPLKVHPTNPRYFSDGTGRAIYMTGSHHWNSLQDSAEIGHPQTSFDYGRYLDFMQAQNHNFMRMWVYEGGGNHLYAEPLAYVRTGPGAVLDGRPLFDLDQFDHTYFDRLRSRVMAARDRGIYVSIMLFNGWGLYDNGFGNPWPIHPFNGTNNVNGVDGGLDIGKQKILHTLRMPAITRRQEAYVRTVVDAVNDLDNVLYEIVNEDVATPENAAWQYHIIDYIHQYERSKPKQHPVGMTVQWPNGSNKVLHDSPADWISPNQEGGYDVNPPATNHGKVVVTDTDHLFGVGGDHSWVWKSFLRGLNPIYMDPLHFITQAQPDPSGAEVARKAMGHTRGFANRMNLAAMVPHGELCSTTFCLANPGHEYLAYLPFGSHWLGPWIEFLPYGVEAWVNSWLCCTVTVDLFSVSGTLNVEWFDLSSGKLFSAGTIPGGRKHNLVAPFPGDAVVHLKAL